MKNTNKPLFIVRILSIIFIIPFTLMCFGTCYTIDAQARSIEPITITILSLIQIVFLFINKTWVKIISCTLAGVAALVSAEMYILAKLNEIQGSFTPIIGPSPITYDYEILLLGHLAFIFSCIIFILQVAHLILLIRYNKSQNNSL